MRVTGIKGAPSHPTTPLGPTLEPKAHQKHAVGPKSSPKTRRWAQMLTPILVGRIPTNISSFTDFFCISRSNHDQPNSRCRDGVVMLSRRDQSNILVSRWYCNGVTSRPMLQIVFTTCPTHAYFELLAQI